MVVIPQQPGALVHRIVVSGRSPRRVCTGHILKTGTSQAEWIEPLERSTVAEPGCKSAMQVGGDPVKRQVSYRLVYSRCQCGINGNELLIGKLIGDIEQNRRAAL